MQSVPITTSIGSSNPDESEVYSIQHYVIKFVSDLRQVCGFLRVLLFPPPIKFDCHDLTELLLKVALNTLTFIHVKLLHVICSCELKFAVIFIFAINTDICKKGSSCSSGICEPTPYWW